MAGRAERPRLPRRDKPVDLIPTPVRSLDRDAAAARVVARLAARRSAWNAVDVRGGVEQLLAAEVRCRGGRPSLTGEAATSPRIVFRVAPSVRDRAAQIAARRADRLPACRRGTRGGGRRRMMIVTDVVNRCRNRQAQSP